MAHLENDNIYSAPCDHSSQLLETGLGTLAAPVPAQATPFCYTGWEALLFLRNDVVIWESRRLLRNGLNLITFHFIYWADIFIKYFLFACYVFRANIFFQEATYNFISSYVRALIVVTCYHRIHIFLSLILQKLSCLAFVTSPYFMLSTRNLSTQNLLVHDRLNVENFAPETSLLLCSTKGCSFGKRALLF